MEVNKGEWKQDYHIECLYIHRERINIILISHKHNLFSLILSLSPVPVEELFSLPFTRSFCAEEQHTQYPFDAKFVWDVKKRKNTLTSAVLFPTLSAHIHTWERERERKKERKRERERESLLMALSFRMLSTDEEYSTYIFLYHRHTAAYH